MRKDYRLYIWENVLEGDYHTGVAFAVARNEKEARKLILKADHKIPEWELDE